MAMANHHEGIRQVLETGENHPVEMAEEEDIHLAAEDHPNMEPTPPVHQADLLEVHLEDTQPLRPLHHPPSTKHR
jgi:hypothetical protein